MERTTDKIEGNAASYRLSTMLPFDVFMELVQFCKKNAISGLSKWDFGVGIRILLMKAKYADMLFELENRVDKLENSQSNSTTEDSNSYVKTFGITKKQEANNGKVQ